MRTIFSTFLLITFLLLGVDFYLKYSSIPDYSFELLNTYTTKREFIHADFNGDGKDEILAFGVSQTAYGAFDTEGGSMPWKFHHMDHNFLSGLYARDVNRDGNTEIVELVKDLHGDSIWCVVRNWDREVLCQTEAVHGINLNDKCDWYPSWDGGFGECEVFDLDTDGQDEIILAANTGHDLRPRGLFVYSYPKGTLLWKYLTGGAPSKLTIAHVDSDSLADIFFGTYSPSNGVEVNGIADSAGYIVRLSPPGRLIWKKLVTPHFVGGWVLLTDLDNDGQFELYTHRIVGKAGGEENVLILEKLDLSTGDVLRRHPLEFPFRVELLTAVVSGSGEKYLVTTRGISILDKNLNLIRSIDLPGHTVFAAADLDGDGVDEILTYKRDSVFILDTLLTKVCVYRSDKNTEIKKADLYDLPSNIYFGKANEKTLYLYDERLGMMAVQCIKLRLAYAAHAPWYYLLTSLRDYDWYTIILFFLSGFLISGIVYQSIMKRLPKPEPTKVPTAIANLLTSLTAFGHGQTASSNLNRLAFLSKNVPGDEKMVKKFAGNLADSIDTFKQFTLRQLWDIAAQLKRAKVKGLKGEGIQRCAAKLETHIESLDVTDLERLGTRAAEIRKTFPPLVEELKGEIKLARASVRKYFQTDVPGEIERVLRSVKPQLVEEQVDTPQVFVRGDVTARAFFHPAEFSTVVEELLSNARVALRQSSKKQIKIKIDMQEDITIRIIDTGPGVEPENFARIFDRGYSTKAGSGGYGLYHVLNTVSKYDGHIRLDKSVPFEETVLVITLTKG